MTLLSVCSQTSFIKRRRFQALPGTSSTCLRLFMSPGGFLPASYQGQQPGPQVWPPRPLFWKWSCGVKPETDLSRVIWAHVASVRNLLQCLLQSKEEGWSCDFFKGKKKKKKRMDWIRNPAFYLLTPAMVNVSFRLRTAFQWWPWWWPSEQGHHSGFYWSHQKFLALFSSSSSM